MSTRVCVSATVRIGSKLPASYQRSAISLGHNVSSHNGAYGPHVVLQALPGGAPIQVVHIDARTSGAAATELATAATRHGAWWLCAETKETGVKSVDILCWGSRHVAWGIAYELAFCKG